MATQLSTYDTKGQKLSFKDTIANVYPVDTPIYSTAKNGKATAKNHQFQEEVLDTPGQNAAVEGAASTAIEQNETVELNSWTQNFEKEARVTDSNEAIGKYGRQKDLARQEMLKGKALMNDIEYAYSHSQAGQAGSTSTARATKSFYNQLDAAGADSVVIDASGDTNGLTEARMLAAHEATYNQGGNPSMFVIPSSEGTTVAAWATTSGSQGDTGSRIRDFTTGKTLTNCVELLETPYGRMTVVLSRFQQADGYASSGDSLSSLDNGLALLVDPDYVENAELRAMRRKRLSTDGSYERTLIDCEVALAVTNSHAHGAVAGFRTS